MEQLVADMATGLVGHALKNYDYFIVPMINPDGYHYSITSDYPFWRKNRKTTGDIGAFDECVGVDLKKNYPTVADWLSPANAEELSTATWTVTDDDHHYRSFNACSHNYADEMPLSEPETSGLDSVMRKYAKQIKLYLNLNAYGKQLALAPAPQMKRPTIDEAEPKLEQRRSRGITTDYVPTTAAADTDSAETLSMAEEFIRILNNDNERATTDRNNRFLHPTLKSEGHYDVFRLKSECEYTTATATATDTEAPTFDLIYANPTYDS